MIGVPEKIPFQLGEYRITPFYLPHTSPGREQGGIIPCPNYGFLIEHEEMGTMIYASDMQAVAVSNGEGCLCDSYGNSYVWNIDRCPFIYEETHGKPLGVPRFLLFKQQRINHMLIESNYIFKERNTIDKNKVRHVIRGHHSLENCIGFIKRNQTSDLRTITLIHLSSDSDPEIMRKEIQEVAGQWCNVAVAEPGLQIKLKKFPF